MSERHANGSLKIPRLEIGVEERRTKTENRKSLFSVNPEPNFKISSDNRLASSQLFIDKCIQTEVQKDENNLNETLKSFISFKNTINLTIENNDFDELEKSYLAHLKSEKASKPKTHRKKTKIVKLGHDDSGLAYKLFSNGDKYHGTLDGTNFNGYGKLTKANGTFYEGGWEQGVKNGRCKEVTKFGEKFIGTYKNGLRDGYGCLKYLTGDTFFGYFSQGNFSNFGLLICKNGLKYKGEWENGVFHGQGDLLYPNGDKYSGNFVQGKKEGEGTFTWKSGPSYNGEWRKGLRHGKGVHTQPNGATFNVRYKEGVRVNNIDKIRKAFNIRVKEKFQIKNDLKELGVNVEDHYDFESSEFSL